MKHTLTPVDLALWAALPMAYTSKVEERITMILDTTRRRTFPRRALLLVVVTGAAAFVPLSVLRLGVMAAPQKTITAESEDMQRERQYVRENSKFLRGQGFSAKAAAAQEQQLAVSPDDYTARLCLLGYYWNSTVAGKPLLFAAARPAYKQQVFWLIRNHPESLLFSRQPLGYPRRFAWAAFGADNALWQTQLLRQPNNALLRGNAAEYYLLSDKALAEQHLLRAQAMEPNNPEWPDRLGELYQINGPFPSAAIITQSSKKALAEYEQSVALASKSYPFSVPADLAEAALAETAFNAGEYDKAKQYAEDQLRHGQNKQGGAPGTEAYAANQVLGRLALRGGDIAGAEAHLLAMGHVSVQGSLNVRSPMQLAKELLEHGDRQPVIAFLEVCTRIYGFPIETPVLEKWRAEVQQGRMPKFDPNSVD